MDKGFRARLDFVRGRLQDAGQNVSGDDVAVWLEDFLRRGAAPALAARWAYLLYFARYPINEELDSFEFDVRTKGMPAVVRVLEASPERAELAATGVEFRLRLADPQKLQLDVSHTFVYAHLSGIQRVVRSLSRGLLQGGRPLEFLVLRNSAPRPTYLTPDEFTAFTEWERKFGASLSGWERFRRRVALVPFYLRKMYREGLHPLVDTIRVAIRVVVRPHSRFGRPIDKVLEAGKVWVEKNWLYEPLHHRVNNSTIDPLPQVLEVAVFEGRVSVHLPELAIEPYRLDYYLLLKKLCPGVRFSMILYDFIPVWNPEYVTLHQGYLDYMRLFRVVDAVSCISQDVERQAKLVVDCIRPGRPPEFAAHELPGALSVATEATQFLDASYEEKPYVLCVGTLEVRKNAISVLRAAAGLMRQGHRFRMVFAGNPGWMAEKFLAEAEELRKEGFDIVLQYSVPEKKLMELYRKALFTVFCSHAEGFGLPIVEALRYRKPVLVSRRGCMHDLAQKLGGCLEVDPDNLEDLQAGFGRLLTEAPLREKLVESIRLEGWPSWQDYARDVHEFASRP